MKARRRLQITLGVLTLITAIVLLAAMLAIGLAALFPEAEGFAKLRGWVQTPVNGLKSIALTLGAPKLYYLLPVLAYIAPALLMSLGSLLMLLRSKGKQGKFVTGFVFAAIGMLIANVFSIVFAKELFAGYAIAAQCGCAALLAVFVLFAGLGLGLKDKSAQTSDSEALPKDQSAEEQTEPAEEFAAQQEENQQQIVQIETMGWENIAEQPQERPEPQPAEVGSEQIETTPLTAAEPAPQQQPQPQADEYVPQNLSVKNTVEEVYGKDKSKQVSDSKLSTLRMLLEMGAISEKEYLSLLDSYLK